MLNRVLGNRYRVVEKVGIGGMAEVYKAQDEVLGRTVAIKIMLPQYASDPNFAARFRQEAQAAANLQSPYIVNIYDWGQDEGTYFIAMEYVRGTDLKTAIEQRGAINQRKVAEIGSQVCAALSVAHGYDIIHRDIKPHNIMVQPDGNAKVMDFGIARAGNNTMTQTGSVLGTAYYVSPEQAQGKSLTPATDLYSLGIVLYEASTGKVPFEAPEAVAVALKQVNEQPAPLRQINPDIDPDFEAIVLRAMAKDPADRYASADEMRTALNNFLAGRPIGAGISSPSAKTAVIGAASGGAAATMVNSTGESGTAVMPSVGQNDQNGGTTYGGLNSRNNKDAAKKARNKKIGIAVGIVAALLVIGLGIAYALGAFSGSEKVTVPTVVEFTQADAEAAIIEAGFEVGTITQEFSETVAAGIVISQTPLGDTQADEGSEIDLVVSKGSEMVTVPDLTNMTASDAEAKLTELGLEFSTGKSQYDSEIDVDRICAQSPAAGESVKLGTKVTYNLSLGAQDVTVPDVTGTSESAATSTLKNAGFGVSVEKEYSSSTSAGTVISQDPSASSRVSAGATVTITVSLGTEPEPDITIPDVTGRSQSAATTTLESAGFRVNVEEAYSSSVSVGNVILQDPTGGSEASAGTTITITVSLGPKPSNSEVS